MGDDAQSEAPWCCTCCGNRRGFRRRGQRPGGRTILTKAGRFRLAVRQVERGSCGRRFAPVLELLGVGRHQRRSVGVAETAAAFATEVAYATEFRLLAELAGIDVSARSVGRDSLSLAPTRTGPEILEVPCYSSTAPGCVPGTPRPPRTVCEARSPGALADFDPTMNPSPALSSSSRLAAHSMPASATTTMSVMS